MLVITEIIRWNRNALKVRGYIHPEYNKTGIYTLRRDGGWYPEDIEEVKTRFHLN